MTEAATALFNPSYAGLEGTALCPSLGSVEQVGKETLPAMPGGWGSSVSGPATATRYRMSDTMVLWKAPTATPDSSFVSSAGSGGSSDIQDITSTITWNMWVDADGQLVRTKAVQTVTGGEGGHPGKATHDSRISGIGETNNITAPAIEP